jgi:hypothetical protein
MALDLDFREPGDGSSEYAAPARSSEYWHIDK